MAEANLHQPTSLADADELRALEGRVRELRSMISDVGSEIDAHKTKVAGAMGAGAFLALLALLAAYDLVAGNAGAWGVVGLTREHLQWLAIAFALAALYCIMKGVSLRRRRDLDHEARIEELQRELDRALSRKEFLESR